MNKKDIFNAFEKLDPKFIEEAAPKENKGIRSSAVFRMAVIAASLALILGMIITAAVFLNDGGDGEVVLDTNKQTEQDTDSSEDNIEKYRDSEYFEIIKSLDAYYEELRNNPPPIEYGEPSFTTPSVEITDNQTKKVEEADIIKRTTKNIFYMDVNVLKAFSIDGEDSKRVGEYEINAEGHQASEFFLSADGKTVTVISSMFGSEEYTRYGVAYTDVLSLDVSDPENIAKKSSVRIRGRYSSARVSDGKLLIFLNYNLYETQIDFDKPETFLPVMDRGNGFEVFPNCNIFCDEVTSDQYELAVMFNEEDLTFEKNIALLSYWGHQYVSKDKIFFTTNGSEPRSTKILCVDYSSTEFKVLGSTEIVGTVKDKWSMDEYDGILRVVTTADFSANLYCISLDNFETVALVEEFAPIGESVQSVRFDKTNAYVCTAISLKTEILDPVFFFDLSDLDNISYKETGTIEGMSTSLIDYGNGYLIGIGNGTSYGYDPSDVLKIEVYKETEDKVVSVCKRKFMPVDFPSEYKAYYIDRQNQLLGFGYSGEWDGDTENIYTDFYKLLKFDPQTESFIEIFNVNLGNYNNDNDRGVYIDGYMYMFGADDFKVVAVDLENTGEEQTIS